MVFGGGAGGLSSAESRMPSWPFGPFARWRSRGFGPSAVVDYAYGGRRGRFKGYPLFGGDTGLERAVRECGVNAVVMIDRGEVDNNDTRRVGEYLVSEGALDVFAVRISVELAPVEVSTGIGGP